jgi:hypothetical protein
MRVVVAGALANKPAYGGEAWVRLAWVRGLLDLGLDVLFVELLHPDRDDPASVEFFRRVVANHGLDGRAALLDASGRTRVGLDREAVHDHANGADLLVNLSGHLPAGRLFDAVRRRAYVDLDPGYTQLWHHGGAAHLGIAEHDVHFTVGTNVGRSGCPIPTCGIRWLPVLPPVLMDRWPAVALPDELRFTTVASWRGAFGPVRIGDVDCGVKAHEFRKILDLPGQVPVTLEIALDIHSGDAADRDRLVAAGWSLADPLDVAATPEAFRDYVRGSGGELSAVQGVYSRTRSGWVSDRSAHYLATGRPVVVQDTGLQRTLPVGEGLLTFTNLAEAAHAVEAVVAEPARHARRARELAEEHFASDRVLTDFLDRALASDSTRRPRAVPRARSILVSGMVAGVPGQGGASWAVLQYLLGLVRLGYDAHVVEELAPDAPGRWDGPFMYSPAARYFRRVVRSLGLEGRATLLDPVSGETVGLPPDRLGDRARSAEVLLDLSGSMASPEWVDEIPIRVYLDLDPGFTQVWAEQGALDLDPARYTHFATVGLEVGRAGCPIPTCGIDWIPTLPPVSLDDWPVANGAPHHGWTTVGHWRAYGSVDWQGERWGQKAHAVRGYIDLPARAGEDVAIALGIHPDEAADIAALREGGWGLMDPARVAPDPVRYRRFVRASTAEIGITKAGYVASKSGWFSDRSACYLASGRPVVAHDTGFSAHLPTGLGLLAFTSVDEAVEAMAAVRAEPARHGRAARDTAERHFAADRVLPNLLNEIDACVRPS